MSKAIIVTGGGSGGHAVPAHTIISKILKNKYSKFYYVGSRKGIEKQIISSADMKRHRQSNLTFQGGMLSSVRTVEDYVRYVTQVCTRFINDAKRAIFYRYIKRR